MSVIVWDELLDRTYESGLDRGVLYPPDASAVPWNGLTSIVEKNDSQKAPVYFDGKKINDLISVGDFEGTLKAITYPEAFTKLDGISKISDGLFLGSQTPKSFGLTYRTKIGNAVSGSDAGYKIHILYNVTAVSSDRTYETQTESPSNVDFEWDISAVPEEVSGYRPTAHIIINSNDFSSELLSVLEGMLYGTEDSAPELLSMIDLILFMLSWFNVIVIDNGDGTWTAYSSRPDGENPIDFPSDGQFAIDPVEVTYLDADTYQFLNLF